MGLSCPKACARVYIRYTALIIGCVQINSTAEISEPWGRGSGSAVQAAPAAMSVKARIEPCGAGRSRSGEKARSSSCATFARGERGEHMRPRRRRRCGAPSCGV